MTINDFINSNGSIADMLEIIGFFIAVGWSLGLGWRIVGANKLINPKAGV